MKEINGKDLMNEPEPSKQKYLVIYHTRNRDLERKVMELSLILDYWKSYEKDSGEPRPDSLPDKYYRMLIVAVHSAGRARSSP